MDHPGPLTNRLLHPLPPINVLCQRCPHPFWGPPRGSCSCTKGSAGVHLPLCHIGPGCCFFERFSWQLRRWQANSFIAPREFFVVNCSHDWRHRCRLLGGCQGGISAPFPRKRPPLLNVRNFYPLSPRISEKIPLCHTRPGWFFWVSLLTASTLTSWQLHHLQRVFLNSSFLSFQIIFKGWRMVGFFCFSLFWRFLGDQISWGSAFPLLSSSLPKNHFV